MKTSIAETGRLLWDKDLVSGLNGNISVRIDEKTILITATKTCLGMLTGDDDILRMTLDGEVLDEGQVSTERLLHTEIYRNFPDAHAVIHTHIPYANAYFLNNDVLEPHIFETRVTLGSLKAVLQNTPSVTDAAPVVEALKACSIAALKNHGVVAMGQDLFDCFLLVQSLEEAAKIDAVSRLYQQQAKLEGESDRPPLTGHRSMNKKFKLFSKEQIDEIVRVVNEDSQLKDLGQQTAMTMDLAVKCDETGDIYSFEFEQGRIKNVGQDEGAEFLISAPEQIWRAVFNQEIDPFVATTQKKMNLRGDFGKISKWYAPCSRIFELWAKVPVE